MQIKKEKERKLKVNERKCKSTRDCEHFKGNGRAKDVWDFTEREERRKEKALRRRRKEK